jgi:hypothetical protein
MLMQVPRPDASGSAFAVALNRLIAILEEENAVLRSNAITAHTGFTDRKNHALRELMVLRRCASENVGGGYGELLGALNRSLGENARLLKLHIAAVGEVSDIIIAGLRGATSDGTYTRNSAARR